MCVYACTKSCTQRVTCPYACTHTYKYIPVLIYVLTHIAQQAPVRKSEAHSSGCFWLRIQVMPTHRIFKPSHPSCYLKIPSSSNASFGLFLEVFLSNTDNPREVVLLETQPNFHPPDLKFSCFHKSATPRLVVSLIKNNLRLVEVLKSEGSCNATACRFVDV